jgi:hypothetical protein
MLITGANAHGFLCTPPSRNAAWACGVPSAPKNYDLMALNAGGVRTTYPNYPDSNPLVYGRCGDPVGKVEHEAGQTYDSGVHSTYGKGEIMDVQVNITAYHKGWFEIQLCPSYPESEDCFQTIHKLSIENTSTEGGQPVYNFQVQLPCDIVCERCVLRWFYTANNSPGLPHEIFLNCADIKIV